MTTTSSTVLHDCAPVRRSPSPVPDETRSAAMLIAVWNMLTTGATYDDPGGDFYTRLDPDRAKHRALDQLRKMGYAVTIEAQAAAG